MNTFRDWLMTNTTADERREEKYEERIWNHFFYEEYPNIEFGKRHALADKATQDYIQRHPCPKE